MIQVPDCASPERVLIINGEQEQCFDALQQIIPSLIDSSRLSSFNRRRPPSTDENLESVQSVNQDEQSTSEVRLLVHQIYCGAIIGKGGQHVKELRQTHKLDIKVFSQCCPMSHERVISLRGKIEDVIECIKVSSILLTINTSCADRFLDDLQFNRRISSTTTRLAIIAIRSSQLWHLYSERIR